MPYMQDALPSQEKGSSATRLMQLAEAGSDAMHFPTALQGETVSRKMPLSASPVGVEMQDAHHTRSSIASFNGEASQKAGKLVRQETLVLRARHLLEAGWIASPHF